LFAHAVLSPSGGMQCPAAQQIELGSAVHVAFEQLEPRDLPFDLPLGTSCQLHLVA
jgi:hypothetical protein